MSNDADRLQFKFIETIKMANTKNIRYRVNLEVHQLKINKNIDFETKIVWKRHQNKAETTSVRHAHGYSTFNQTLTLEFNLAFNTETMLFESKNTEILAVIEFQGKVKSGGYAKYNISDNLNNNPHGVSKVSIPLTQCPDPAAFVEVSFSYERMSQEYEADEQSVLNASSRDLNMSRVDFHDDKLSLQMDRINQVITKFQNLSSEIKKKGNDTSKKVPEMKTQMEVLEGQKKALQSTVAKLQKQLKDKQQNFKQERKRSKRQSQDLQKQLQKKSKQIKEAKLNKGIADKTDYKELYENTLKELEELKVADNGLRKSLDFRFASQMEDVKEVANFQSKDDEGEGNQDLARQNVQLQSKVASMSHKLAQLFNASYEYGGAKLLDYLQTSIGLTELDA